MMALDVLRDTLAEPTSTSTGPEGMGNIVKFCRAGDSSAIMIFQ